MNTSPLPEDYAKLADLIHALCEKTITPEQRAQLEEWVCRDPAARRIYVRYMNLHAGLRWRVRQDGESGVGLSPETPRAARAPVLGFLGECVQQSTSFLARPMVFLAVAAIGLPGLLVLALALGILWQAPREAQVAWRQLPQPHVAMITRAYGGGSRRAPGPSLSAGRVFAEGETISLERGLLEITFADGARVILEERATLEISNCNAGRLQIGRLAATVPDGAHGFTIDTPTARVVDLGTDFGVSVAADRTAEAHVFGGQIEVTPKTGAGSPAAPTRRLVTGEAARIRAAAADQVPRIEAISASSDEFVRRFPDEEPPIAQDRVPSTPRLVASVDRRDGARGNRAPIGEFGHQTDPLSSDASGLVLGAPVYSDRVYTVEMIDEPLVGADYVRAFNSDKFDANHRYDVTFSTARDQVFVVVLLDDRTEATPQRRQALVDRLVSPFARPGDFVDTGWDIDVDDGQELRHPLSAYGMTVPTKSASGNPITYSFVTSARMPQRASHFIIAVLPEPPSPER
ncbi:MAG: FecR domain-containing protein [Pirellulales bacterium]|nr:FecR domain-containing protein [Pirellulales bacterium]